MSPFAIGILLFAGCGLAVYTLFVHFDERSTVLEILTSLRRAGADTIVSYHAKDAAEWLAERT